MTNEGMMSPADFAALNGNNNGMWDNGAWWIIILFLFAGWGGRGYGGFGGGYGSGAADNYVLTSDFAQVERKLDSITNGLCDGFYTQAQLVNGTNTALMQGFNQTQAQLAQCCCDNRAAIADVNYNMATHANGIERQIERGFCDTNYNMATQNCQTLQAIDKVGDRVIDWLATKEAQALRDENFTLKLAASQAQQNNVLINQLRPAPIPAFPVPNPYVYNNGCGCNCG